MVMISDMKEYCIIFSARTAVHSFYSESRASVKGESTMREWFDVKVGLRLDCSMSHWIFNMIVDGLLSR